MRFLKQRIFSSFQFSDGSKNDFLCALETEMVRDVPLLSLPVQLDHKRIVMSLCCDAQRRRKMIHTAEDVSTSHSPVKTNRCHCHEPKTIHSPVILSILIKIDSFTTTRPQSHHIRHLHQRNKIQ